jgi:diaminopimelate epimerase
LRVYAVWASCSKRICPDLSGQTLCSENPPPAGFLFAHHTLWRSLSITVQFRYVKYESLGNSFIILDRIFKQGRADEYADMARTVCDTNHIGADGLLILSRPSIHYRVDVYNADGSWAEKSGNGLRMAALHLVRTEKESTRLFSLETGSGPSRVSLQADENPPGSHTVSASLGSPVFEATSIPVKTKLRFFINQPIKLAGRSYLASAVSIGNPHLILFCDDFDFDWQAVGKTLETKTMFPERINVGFVMPVNAKRIRVHDWERGVGPTGSSGTGAAAAVAISVMRGFTGRDVIVSCPAGDLAVSWKLDSDEIWIEGPVIKVSEGDIDL